MKHLNFLYFYIKQSKQLMFSETSFTANVMMRRTKLQAQSKIFRNKSIEFKITALEDEVVCR